MEWLNMIEKAEAGCSEQTELIISFIERLSQRQKARGHVYNTDRSVRPFLIIRHNRPFRVAWDMVMMCLLFYISLSLPYSLGFGQPEELENVDRTFDFLFCIDLLLNFRTSYIDSNDNFIVDGKKIAFKYMKSWFL